MAGEKKKFQPMFGVDLPLIYFQVLPLKYLLIV